MLQQSVPQTLENGRIFFGKDGKGSCWEPYHTPCNASQQKNDMLAIWPAPLFFVLPGVGRQDSFLSLFLVYKTQKVMLACVLFLLLLVNLNAIDNSFHVKFRGECIMKLKAWSWAYILINKSLYCGPYFLASWWLWESFRFPLNKFFVRLHGPSYNSWAKLSWCSGRQRPNLEPLQAIGALILKSPGELKVWISDIRD